MSHSSNGTSRCGFVVVISTGSTTYHLQPILWLLNLNLQHPLLLLYLHELLIDLLFLWPLSLHLQFLVFPFDVRLIFETTGKFTIADPLLSEIRCWLRACPCFDILSCYIRFCPINYILILSYDVDHILLLNFSFPFLFLGWLLLNDFVSVSDILFMLFNNVASIRWYWLFYWCMILPFMELYTSLMFALVTIISVFFFFLSLDYSWLLDAIPFLYIPFPETSIITHFLFRFLLHLPFDCLLLLETGSYSLLG